MVKLLTAQDHEQLHAAIKNARQKTAAHIHVTVRPFSDDYHDYALFYGMALGGLIDILLWASGMVVDFPPLLTILLCLALMVDLVPEIRSLCLTFIPQTIKHHRAGHAALNDFHALQAHVPQGEPFILLFVSVAERYVHVITNPVAHNKLPDHWKKVTADFAVAMRKKHLASACLQAVDQIADRVAAVFPPRS